MVMIIVIVSFLHRFSFAILFNLLYVFGFVVSTLIACGLSFSFLFRLSFALEAEKRNQRLFGNYL